MPKKVQYSKAKKHRKPLFSNRIQTTTIKEHRKTFHFDKETLEKYYRKYITPKHFRNEGSFFPAKQILQALADGERIFKNENHISLEINSAFVVWKPGVFENLLKDGLIRFDGINVQELEMYVITALGRAVLKYK